MMEKSIITGIIRHTSIHVEGGGPVAETEVRRTLQIVIFLCALLFLMGFSTPQAVQAQAIVSVDSISDVQANSTVEVVVRIANPSGVAGFQFDLKYDSQVAIVTDVMAGSFLPAGTFLKNLNDAARGSIRVVWLKSQTAKNIDSSGELCRVVIRLLSPESTYLRLAGLELADQNGGTIIGTVQDGRLFAGGSSSSGGSTSGDFSSGGVSISTASSLPYARKGSYYSCSLVAAGGAGSYTWERVSGSLPPGLYMSGNGIYGTPTNVGKFDFRLRASNAGGWAEKSFTLWVLDEGSQVPYLYADSASPSSYSDRVSFKNLKITQGSMELNLSPENMPYIMIVDGSINWVNLLVSLNAAGDMLYINNVGHASSQVKSIPLTSGSNEVTFYVKSSGKTSAKYLLTIYRMPGRR